MIRSFALGLVSAVALVASAQAADIYRGEGSLKDGPVYAPVASWTGFYVGVHGGYAWGDVDIKDKDSYAAGAPAGTKTNLDADGFFAGGTIGYNMQRGALVFGVEADIGYMDLDKTKLLTGTASGTKVGVEGGLYADFTGRLGYAMDRTLIYAKGGLAIFDGEEKFSTVTGSFSRKTSVDTYVGYTVGGGIEYMINPGWSLKAEYLYFDFGDEKYTVFNAGGTPFRFEEDITAHTVKVGLNYKFNRDVEPLK